MIAYRIHNDATDETTGYYEHEEEARVAVECAREFHQSDDWRAEEVDIVMSPIGFLAELETLRAELAAAQKAHALVCDSLASIQDEQVAPLQAENCRLAAELAEIRLALGLAVHEGFTGEDRTVQEFLAQARAEAKPTGGEPDATCGACNSYTASNGQGWCSFHGKATTAGGFCYNHRPKATPTDGDEG